MLLVVVNVPTDSEAIMVSYSEMLIGVGFYMDMCL
jgi:hypothetical protein